MKTGMKEDMGVANEMTLSNLISRMRCALHAIAHDTGLNTVISSFQNYQIWTKVGMKEDMAVANNQPYQNIVVR